MVLSIKRGQVFWANLDPTQGREQAGRRPVVVISSNLFLTRVDTLITVIPATTTDRNWPNHVCINGPDVRLSSATFAMTEQPRTITRERLGDSLGYISAATQAEIDMWLKDFLGLYN